VVCSPEKGEVKPDECVTLNTKSVWGHNVPFIIQWEVDELQLVGEYIVDSLSNLYVLLGCESVIDSIWTRKSHQSSVILNQRGDIDSRIRVTSV